MPDKEKHNEYRALKIFLMVLTVFVGLQLLGRYVLTTKVFHDFVKGKIESIANEKLNAKLHIGKLEGDLWEEIQLTRVSIVDKKPLFIADTLYARYNIWSFLKEVYEINQLKAVGVNSYITENEDSVFNFQQLMKENTVDPESQTKSSSVKMILSKIDFIDINSRVFSPSYLPDSILSIKNLNASASLSNTDSISATISSLNFLILEGRLPEPIKIKTSASLVGEQVSLEEMVIETGRSILKAKASINTIDSTITAEASTLPFSLVDVQPYLDTEIPDEELNLVLSISGSMDNIRLNLFLNHPFAENIEMVAGINLRQSITLTDFGLKGGRIDFAHFTNDSIAAEVGDFSISMSGTLNDNIPMADLYWDLNLTNIQFEEYYIERMIASGALKNDNFTARIGFNQHLNEQININSAVYSISSETPRWEADFNVNEFDFSKWVDTGNLNTQITFYGTAEGKGFTLSESPWEYSIQSHQSEPNLGNKKTKIAGQLINEYELKGSISKDIFESEGFISLNKSRFDFELDAEDLFDGIPEYNYYITTSGFDFSEVNQTADFPTYINMDIYGEGRGLDPEDRFIYATINIDSSIVNGAKFENLKASATLTEGVLNVSDGILKSDIIEGEFSGRKNISDETDPENWLLVDMQVKNILPLAPLVNVERLNATGEIKGRITQDTSNILRGNMELDLEDIIIDSLFIASRISGITEIEMKELRKFNLNLSIESPIISGLTFQDIELISEGIANEDTLQSTFNLDIIGSDRGKLVQNGSITMDHSEENTMIKFERFNFISQETELAITRPFTFNIDGKTQSISTDTLDLKSDLGAFLQLSIPYADSLEQYGWFVGKDFDIGIIQEVVFGERFLDGVLSGQVFFNKSEDDLTGSGSFNLTEINYEGVEADSLDLLFDLRQERLFAATSVSWDEEEKIVGNIDVPFVLTNPSEFDDNFYNQLVEGSLTINPSELSRFKLLLEQFGVTETDGIINFDGSISGTAGEPNFEGALVLNDPVLSGIKVDTVTASFNYDNIIGGLQIQSEVIAAKQKAAQVEIIYPIEYDFRAYELILPDDEQIIRIIVKTDNFNIAVFNDFLDKEYLNGLRGTLNADIELEGVANKMIPSGYLRLSGGRVSVPFAGITIDGIKSDVEFTENGLNVKEITAKSGSGNFNANGTVQLEGIIPKTINLNAKATQFRLANTDDYNLTIDLNSRLTGNAKRPKATGKLTVRNGFIFLQDFGENTIEVVQLEGEEVNSFNPYDSLAIDMVFEIQRNFYVRNSSYLDMEIELAGQLDAQKETNGELSLFGSVNGVKGYVRPLGKLFRMEQANFTFSGSMDNPDLNIRSKYTPPTRQKGESVELYYVIGGTAQTPEFSFDSNPYMEQSDIICYTLFGKPCYSLESWQSVFTSGGSPSATDVLTDVLLDEVEALATRELGVDVVQIDNTGETGGTSIKTGWYINERTFFAIINEITGSSPKTLFVLEYLLSETWDLILTQGGDTRRGIDFRFQYDY